MSLAAVSATGKRSSRYRPNASSRDSRTRRSGRTKGLKITTGGNVLSVRGAYEIIFANFRWDGAEVIIMDL